MAGWAPIANNYAGVKSEDRTNTCRIRNMHGALFCTDVYGTGSIHRSLQQSFQAKWLAYLHLKGVGDQLGEWTSRTRR